MLSLIALFTAAFVAATLLPAQSEIVLAGLILRAEHGPALLVAVATAGNVLGSLVNWGIGRFALRFRDRRWFPLRPPQLEAARRWYARWGYWSLLASWVPVIGDPITLAAGVMREPLPRFVLLVTLAKAGRYLAVAYAARAFG